MAFVNITNFTLQQEAGGDVEMKVDFKLSHTGAEKSNNIPTRVWLRLMERNGARDSFHLNQSWNGVATQTGVGIADTAITPWLQVGTFAPNKLEGSHTRTLKPAELNVEVGKEEFYVVAVSRPDLRSNVSISRELTFP